MVSTQVSTVCLRLRLVVPLVRFMSPTILSRRYAPAASVQSVVLPSRFRVVSYCRRVGLWTLSATSTASAAAASTVRYARRPRRTLYLHDCQRASRKLSVHAVAFCALCPPLYCPGATRPVVLPHAFGLPAIVAGWTWCATSTASAAAASTVRYASRPRLAGTGARARSQGGRSFLE